ncbi:hypothetical protein A3K86_15340 [Photobacterium jeanii]|uniref:Uncharacterized protein n=1 Tax=Photobacterium jeanii TaxID=858640 RepID=A0A178K6S3_9GAMM|nr:hypothetical protein [Photobacterium jeanii]OAN13038.1 hypothetical protein A3K86_15340 [Photobacterium jeanii]PST89186.1 hypothetical protein C9I91_13785 [Photobacterium jeanii]
MNRFHLPSQLSSDLELELQHIYLEVNAERYHYLPQFFEAYYCHRHNLVTKQGKVDWEAIFDFAPRSQAARGVSQRKELVREWLLPTSVVVGQLKALVRDEELSLTNIQAVLDCALQYVILTRGEAQALKQKGLQTTMPASYYQPSHQDYQKSTARFDKVNIHIDGV